MFPVCVQSAECQATSRLDVADALGSCRLMLAHHSTGDGRMLFPAGSNCGLGVMLCKHLSQL